MMKQILLCSLCLLLPGFWMAAQNVDLYYYLPKGTYDPNVPTPEEVLGYQVGEWHVSHDQLVHYMYVLAERSDRVLIEETGRTYENRPLLLLTISAPENLARIDALRKEHLARAQGNPVKPLREQPVVLYQGYSIHGNEASGSNAALLVAYYLAASQSEEVVEMLKQLVVLFDPCYNPDGLNRFASWVNMHKSFTPVTDPQSREFREVWPQGRTNHYWFDLNRDWLPVQHPESRARIRSFHRWLPNVLTDHHEMGTNSTYFFQPGVPQRTNPFTPLRNQELTAQIAEFHAKALDELGSLYYSKERYDDFYYGKGSTYPDINGSIGILFEQASSRGHIQQSIHGDLSFPFAIRNQVATSLSSLRAGVHLREELLSYQQTFFEQAMAEAEKLPYEAFLFSSGGDAGRMEAFCALLELHEIEVMYPAQSFQLGGEKYEPGVSCVVPVKQKNYRLLKAMFERQLQFDDSLFYDVSAWTLPLAFGLDQLQLNGGDYGKIQSYLQADPPSPESFDLPVSSYAYVFSWEDYRAPRLLYALQKRGLRCKVAMRPFTDAEGREFARGSILLPVEGQVLSKKSIHELLRTLQEETGVRVYAVDSGNSSAGLYLGSTYFEALSQPRVALLVGQGVTPYDAGEVWHLLDRRYGMPVSLLDVKQLARLNLSSYDVMIMVNGSYSGMSSQAFAKLESWVKKGGVLIAMRSANRKLSNKGLLEARLLQREKADTAARRPYEMYERDAGAQVIGGAIVQARLDLTHPLCFGYANDHLPLMRKGTVFFDFTHNPYATPLLYTDAPLLAGYISDDNLKLMAGKPAVVVSGMGSGRIISFADNPNFRAFWYGTNKLFANAVFFGRHIAGEAVE